MAIETPTAKPSAASTATNVPKQPVAKSKAVVAAVSASALEGYDLTIYGLFAVTISQVFFPAENQAAALLLTVATLGFGYLVRPLGGIVMGAYSDKHGRKAAIFLTVTLMAVSTGVIGLVPSYAQIGIWAPILVMAARLVQGFAAGGAAGSSIAYLAESAPPGKRGFYASWQQASQIGAFLFSSAVAALITNSLSQADVESWGWRIPFLLAIAFGPLSLLIRRYLPEPEIFEKQKAPAGQKPRLAQAVAGHTREIGVGFGVTCLWSVTFFLLLIFMPTYANKTFGIPLSGTFLAATIGSAIVFVLCPLMGSLSDRVGRSRTMLVSAALLLALIYPLFHYVSVERTVMSLIVVQSVFAVFIAGYTGPVCAFMAELFPTRIRSTGLSISYNIGVLVVGAFAPLVTTWLIATTNDPLSPAYYVMGVAVISIVALLMSKDSTGKALAS
ncbi:MFS transporter [Telluria beijingensis]|uniref:MFS transporter n=1 Tax=Telluria beijingensis TaxID=3068633 RepID=UPI0027956B5E|nr:MFS transporter [Massilia sp. REN29]